METDAPQQAKSMSARRHAVIAALAGVVAAGLFICFGPWQLAPVVAWDVMALVYVAWTMLKVLRLTAQETAIYAQREDPSRAATTSLLLLASVVSLLAVGILIVRASHDEGWIKTLQVGLGVLSVVLSWSLVHTIFTLHYARLYYSDPVGGVDFNNEDERPSYLDFAYLSFTIGMTFQVSDTSLSTQELRATALRHALLSYLFGTVIVATTINLVAGLSK